MNAPLKAIPSAGNLQAAMGAIGREARAAARQLALAGAAQKNRALAAMAKSIRASRGAILAANAEDVAEAKVSGASPRIPRPIDAHCRFHRSHGGRH